VLSVEPKRIDLTGVVRAAVDAFRAAHDDFHFELQGAAAPLWAGLIALADQEAKHPLGFVNPAIYRIARSSNYHKAFHDVISGNNTMTLVSNSEPITITGYRAGPGWDPVTGWGTPDARVFVSLLAR
jgi:subtilase family serine protease